MRQSDHTLARPSPETGSEASLPRFTSLVDRATLGASGRIWTLPFDALTYNDSHLVSFTGPNERDCVALTCKLLRPANPTLHEEWRTAFIEHIKERRARITSASVSPSSECLINSTDHSKLVTLLPLRANVRVSPEAPPHHVEAPEIHADHWYYKRHFTHGSYTAPVAMPDSEKLSEVTQDISSLRYYLNAYDRLARETTGQHLFEATTWALFKAPYFSCMEMCIRDLKLPSHFLAFIHYGIGTHLAIGQPYLLWNQTTATTEEARCLAKTQEVFNLLAKLYTEDFPRPGQTPSP